MTDTHRPPTFDAADYETFDRALDVWGIDAQADLAEEEAAEFVVASKHYAREKIDAAELVDELADMRIIAHQLSVFFGEDVVEQRIAEKMDRLRDRLDKAESE